MLDALDLALTTSTYKHYRPLSDAADEYVHWAQNPAERVYMGVPLLDKAMRGTAPRQLTGIVGYSQGGKTLLLTHMALHEPNRDRGFAWFTADESRMSMMVKLTAAKTGTDARVLERMLADPSTEKAARDLLHETAEALPNLFVCEDNLYPHEMWEACQEFEDARQMPVDAVVFDFARLLKVEGDERAKLEALKFWTNEHEFSTFVIHQTSRTSGRDGEPITLSSGAYGGEDVFTHQIGVRRKARWHESLLRDFRKAAAKETDPRKAGILRELIEEQEIEILLHQNTVTINLVKNKVPPCELVDEFDLTLDHTCGRLVIVEEPRVPMARELF